MRTRAIKITASAALIAALVAIMPCATASADAPSQSGEAALVIDLINQLRAEYGLAPYTVNATLMAVAQSHADYQASIGTVTHTGAGGTRPRDRVIAAGYGPDGSTFVHENIYGGGNATPYDAVAWWRNSAIHLQGMTQTSARNIGTGFSRSADGSTYYVALFAMTSGSGARILGNRPGGSGQRGDRRDAGRGRRAVAHGRAGAGGVAYRRRLRCRRV